MEKYGFVYIWFDKKHKRFYIGCRWGHENDGYVCSSPWMKQAYKHRPNDFRRRILSKIYTNKKDLLSEEYKWISMIKDVELGKRYYNLHNHHFNHWSTDENKRLTIGQKISDSPNRVANISKANKGHKVSEETKEKLRLIALKQFEDADARKLLSKKVTEMWNDPEYRKINTENKRGKKQSQETLDKRRLTKELTGRKGGPSKGSIPWNKGKGKI